jgi:hypothetical protein
MYQTIPTASRPVFRGASPTRALTPSSLSMLTPWDPKQIADRATRPAGNGTAKQARPPRGGPR